MVGAWKTQSVCRLVGDGNGRCGNSFSVGESGKAVPLLGRTARQGAGHQAPWASHPRALSPAHPSAHSAIGPPHRCGP